MSTAGRPISAEKRAQWPLKDIPGECRKLLRRDHGGQDADRITRESLQGKLAAVNHPATERGIEVMVEWGQEFAWKHIKGSGKRLEHNYQEMERRGIAISSACRNAVVGLDRLEAMLLPADGTTRAMLDLIKRQLEVIRVNVDGADATPEPIF